MKALNILFFLSAFTIQCAVVSAQSANAGDKNPNQEAALQLVDIVPEYPGGNKALIDFIIENINYPKNAIDNKISGTVWIQFIVGKTGKLYGAEVLKSVSPELDKEALRVVNLMPVWAPGQHEGKNVNVYMRLPIKFALKGNNKVKD